MKPGLQIVKVETQPIQEKEPPPGGAPVLFIALCCAFSIGAAACIFFLLWKGAK